MLSCCQNVNYMNDTDTNTDDNNTNDNNDNDFSNNPFSRSPTPVKDNVKDIVQKDGDEKQNNNFQNTSSQKQDHSEESSFTNNQLINNQLTNNQFTNTQLNDDMLDSEISKNISFLIYIILTDESLDYILPKNQKEDIEKGLVFRWAVLSVEDNVEAFLDKILIENKREKDALKDVLEITFSCFEQLNNQYNILQLNQLLQTKSQILNQKFERIDVKDHLLLNTPSKKDQPTNKALKYEVDFPLFTCHIRRLIKYSLKQKIDIITLIKQDVNRRFKSLSDYLNNILQQERYDKRDILTKHYSEHELYDEYIQLYIASVL